MFAAIFRFRECETKGQFSETSFFFSAHLCSDSFYAFRRTLDPSLLSSDVAKKSECSHLRPPTLCISLKLLECRFSAKGWADSGHRGAAFNSHRGAKVRCGSAVRCVTRRQGIITGFGFGFSDKVQYRMPWLLEFSPFLTRVACSFARAKPWEWRSVSHDTSTKTKI